MGVCSKPAGDFQAPLHAAGKLFNRIVAALPQFEQLEQHFDAFGPQLARHVVQHAVKIHVFVGGEFVVQAGILEHDAETFAGFVVLHAGVEPVQLAPCRWWA